MRIIRWTEDGGWATDIDQSAIAYPVDHATFERLRRVYADVFDIANYAPRRRRHSSRLTQKIFATVRKRIAAIVYGPGNARVGRS